MEQRRLDFVRGQQLQALTRLALKVGEVMRTGSGETIKSGHVMWLLSRIDNAAGKIGSCFKSVDTLAEETKLKPRMVRRALSALDYAGWILQQRERTDWGVRLHRRVCWSNVLAYLDGEEDDNTLGDAHAEALEAVRSAREITGSPEVGAIGREGVTVSVAAAPSLVKSAVGSWQAVQLRLSQLGAEYPQASLAAAQRAGVTLAEVQARIAHWEAEQTAAGWSIGALVRSVAESVPGLPVDRGWPAAVKGQQQHAGPSPREQAEQRVRAERQAEQQSAGATLESHWGPLLDQLAAQAEGAERLLTILHESSSYLASWVRKQNLEGAAWVRIKHVRAALLRAADAGQFSQ